MVFSRVYIVPGFSPRPFRNTFSPVILVITFYSSKGIVYNPSTSRNISFQLFPVWLFGIFLNLYNFQESRQTDLYMSSYDPFILTFLSYTTSPRSFSSVYKYRPFVTYRWFDNSLFNSSSRPF